MPDDDLKELQNRVAALEARTERFERIYREWTNIEDWIRSLPETEQRIASARDDR